MNITYENRVYKVSPGTTIRSFLEQNGLMKPGILAVQSNGQAWELTDALTFDCTLKPLTLCDEEGRRIYERSLRFVMLLAVRRLLPGQRVRIEYSAGQGVYVQLPGLKPDTTLFERIKIEMEHITAADLPFTKKIWALQDAIRYFREDGQQDKVELLTLRPYDSFTMYCIDGMWDYFYGIMAPSTGSVKVFSIIPKERGFVLQLPVKEDPANPAGYIERPKHLTVFEQSAHWCTILGIKNAADLSALYRDSKFRQFIRVNEALHDQAIGSIAHDIAQKGKRIIFVSGPSSSGKTTFAHRLDVHLRVLGFHPVIISLDNYYLDRDKIPLEPDGTIDLESIHTLDLPCFQQQMLDLLAGQTVALPVFNFKTGKREEHGTPLTLEPGQPIIIEGIHGLNPQLSESIGEDIKYRIFVSALTCLNLDDHNRIRTTDVRLLRRIVRDNQFRGTQPAATLAMWPSVRAGEETWIFPYQENADVMFNTALHYELPFLKKVAYDLLQAIPDSSDVYLPARRLLKILHYIPEISHSLYDEVPPTSILREFIGGSGFDKD
ncbi:MAG: nucleoside kinase [Clostridia bacterium]|nr:nucleoside kinase [Clostridia bacterium]